MCNARGVGWGVWYEKLLVGSAVWLVASANGKLQHFTSEHETMEHISEPTALRLV